MPVPNAVRHCEEGNIVSIRTKLLFDPNRVRNHEKASLDDEWQTVAATRAVESWKLVFKNLDDQYEEVVSDENEEKSLMLDNLWDCGWYQMCEDIVLAENLKKDDVPSKLQYDFRGETFLFELKIPNLDGIDKFQLYSEVFLGGHLYLETEGMVQVHREPTNIHVYFFTACPVIDGAVSEVQGRLMAVIYNLLNKRGEFIPLDAIEPVPADKKVVTIDHQLMTERMQTFMHDQKFVTYCCEVIDVEKCFGTVPADETNKENQPLNTCFETRTRKWPQRFLESPSDSPKAPYNLKVALTPSQKTKNKGSTRSRSVGVLPRNNHSAAKPASIQRSKKKESQSEPKEGGQSLPPKNNTSFNRLEDKLDKMIDLLGTAVSRCEERHGNNSVVPHVQQPLPQEVPLANHTLVPLSHSIGHFQPTNAHMGGLPFLLPQGAQLFTNPQPSESEALKTMKLMCFMQLMNGR
jgi:hypothetical protein